MNSNNMACLLTPSTMTNPAQRACGFSRNAGLVSPARYRCRLPKRSTTLMRCSRCRQSLTHPSFQTRVSIAVPRTLPAVKATKGSDEAGQRSTQQNDDAAYDSPSFNTSTDKITSEETSTEQTDGKDSLGVRVALSMLNFYRKGISPLMPKACRYVPSCSEYSIDAYKTYGVAKGSVLTAWRLMRCNPIGGKGYDPVQWPPPRLAWLFGADYSAEVAVVLALATFGYLLESGAFNIL